MPTGSSRSPRRSTPPSSSRLPPEGDAGAHPDLEALLATFAANQDDKLAAFADKQAAEHNTLRSDFKADLAAFIGPLDKGYRKRFDKLELEQADSRADVKNLKDRMEQLSVRVVSMEAQLHSAAQASSPSAAVDNDDFHRAPLDTVIRIRTQLDTTSTSLLAPFRAILDEMRLEDSAYDWDSPPVGRNGSIVFQGSADLCRLRVRKFMSLLKDNAGKWRRFEVEAATGERVPAYADIDKNRATIRGETLSRRLARFLADRELGGTFRARKQDYSVSRDWVPFAKIVDLSPDSFAIKWNLEATRGVELDRDACTRAFIASIDPQAQVSWG